MRYQSPWHAVLLAARVLFASSPAYIHPDEYFQAPEVTAGDIFNIEALRTWEFTTEAPVRSIVPIYLFSGTPHAVLWLIQRALASLGWQLELTPRLLFCTNRIFMAILSFAIDGCIIRAIQRQYPKACLSATRLVLATSFCLAVFHSHTFANSFASVVLAVCFDLLSAIEAGVRVPNNRVLLKHKCLLLGVALALGTFTHVSFPMFALPVGLVAVLLLIRAASFAGLLAVVGGGLSTLLAIVVVDSLYYGTLQLQLVGGIPRRVSGALTCTVLNNVLYNSNNSNLATHGIHPWYNHMLLSMPTLFGPLAILAVAKGWAFVKSAQARQGTCYVSVAAALSVVTGLGMLSMVPHQEPRFLVPMLPALVICTWRWHRIASAYFWYPWIAFNAVLSVLYGVVHQAGVVPAVEFISQTSVFPLVECQLTLYGDAACTGVVRAYRDVAMDVDNAKVLTNVLLFASYMAPRHLLAQPANKDTWQARAEIRDLISMEDAEVQALLRESVYASCTLVEQELPNTLLVAKETSSGHFERTLLVMPASVDIQRIVPPEAAYSVVRLFSYAPHVNFDHVGEILQSPAERAQLHVYAICSR